MTVIDSKHFERDIRHCTLADRRELRNFSRFLKLKDAGWLFDMLERPRWLRYMGLTPEEAKTVRGSDILIKYLKRSL